MAQTAQMTPRDYYMDLVQRLRMPPAQAMQEVQRRYGAPQTPQQKQETEQKQESTAQLAQAGGMIAGVVAGKYVMNNAGKWIDMLTGKEVAKEVVNQAATQAGAQAGATAATQVGTQAGTATSANLPNVNTDLGYQTPEFQLSGKTTVIDTPAGKQSIPIEAQNDPGFLSGVNWTAVANGTVSLLQAYQAYKAYQSGDKLGAGIYGAGAVATGAAAASAAGVGGTTASTLGSAAPVLGAAAGAYGAYKTSEALGEMAAGKQRMTTGVVGGATSGAAMGSVAGPYGAAIGAVVGAVAGAAGAYFGSSKKKPQMTRDAIRGVLKQGGILDNKFQGTLADGSKFDFGQDGSHLKWKNIDKLAAQTPNAWNSAVPLSDALATAYGFVGQKASDISAWYARAAVSNAGDDPNVAKKNMQHFAQQQGITYDQIKSKLDEAIADNRISQSQYDTYLSGAKELTAGVGAGTGAKFQPPKTGEVARVSPGMYMNDKGQVSRASSMRQALESNYGKKEKK